MKRVGRGIDRREFIRQSAGGVLIATVAGSSAYGETVEVPIRTVTRGPKHHFFGYYDKFPWDRTGRYLLAMEVDFMGRQPNAGEKLIVGMIDLEDEDQFIPFDETLAWSWQQGTMLQWLGSDPDSKVIYNSVRGDSYVAIVRDVFDKTTHILPKPIYALSPDGSTAVGLDYDRLHRLRPGYGYLALPEKYANERAPEKGGIYVMNVATGDHKLIVPIAWAAANQPKDTFKNAEHWFNHLQFNPGGSRFCFFHRWKNPDMKTWNTRFYSAKPDGTDIRLHVDNGMVSHFDWRDDDTLLVWARKEVGDFRFITVDVNNNEVKVVGEGVLTEDGHCSYSPDRKWILNDTYPNKESKQTLMLFNPAENRRVDIGSFFSPPAIVRKPFRCDLHPRWNRTGTQVCIDSAHEEPTRQIYLLDVSSIV